MAAIPVFGSGDRAYRMAWWVLGIALFCGGVLRLIWIEDMEWKRDEQWSYQMSQEVGRTRPWEWVGMPTSLGFPNPGLSVWIFVAIGRVASSPTALARAVALVNIIGLIGFAGAVRAYLPAKEREPWLWGIALQAVSPFAIRLSRKIWPPSILTPFLLLLWVSHWHRQTRWGAFAWGLVGALIGQVHLSGWFVAAGLVLGTVIAELWNSLPRSRYWHWWLLGTVLGLASALPWACALNWTPPGGVTKLMIIRRIFGHTYGLGSTALSVRPYQVLGLGLDARPFRLLPMIAGIPTHGTELVGFCIELVVIVRIAVRLIQAVFVPASRRIRSIISDRAGVRQRGLAATPSEPAVPSAESSFTSFYLWSTIVIPSVIFLLITDVYFYHYYFVLCPFLFVLLAACLLPWRRVLLGLVISQAVLSCVYLDYIHQKGGTGRGEYGLSYARQGNR